MADQQQLFRQGALAAWYESAKSALYLNRTLREWLDSYAEPQRPEAAKLALVHGVTCLRKSFGNKVLSLEQLKHATGQGQHAIALHEELPLLHHGVAQIRQLLDGFDQDLSIDNTKQHPQHTPGYGQIQSRQARQQGGCQGAAVATLPACSQHDHQDLAVQQHTQQQIYPAWWGHHTSQLLPQQVKISERQRRPPPRLAYSIEQQPELGKSLHSNDLVTAAYLDVPSSGYAAAQPVSARRALTWTGPADRSTAGSLLASGKENTAGTAGVEQKSAKLKQHVVVKSRVKQQLQQAHSLHQQRGKARQQRLQAALLPRRPPMPQRFSSTPGQRSTERQYMTEQPPADIADSILANPWTAALMQGDADKPQLYSNSLALTRLGIGSWAPEPDPDADAVQQQGLQAHSGSQPVPDSNGTAVPSSAETDAASLHSFQVEDERRLEGASYKEHTDSCSSTSKDDRHSGHNLLHGKLGSGQEGCRAQRQERCKPAGPVQRSVSNVAPDNRHADASTSSSDRATSGRGPSPSASGPTAAEAQPACYTDWAAAFTSKHGKETGGLGQHGAGPQGAGPQGAGPQGAGPQGAGPQGAAPQAAGPHSAGLQGAGPQGEDEGAGSGRQRGFASWIGDFGHLEGSRFTKQQGKAWQAYMHSQRDQPAGPSSTPHSITDEGDEVCDSKEDDGNKDSSTLSNTSNGRWDFARIIKENL